MAKHTQKHSDRPDKRPPLPAGALPGSANGGAGGAGGGATNNQSQNAAGVPGQTAAQAAAAAAAAVGLGMPVSGQAGSQLTAESYWPKMDPAAYGVHDRDYQSLMDPRLNPHARDINDPRNHMEDLRAHSGFVGGNGGYDHTGGNAGNIKGSSAFSPIQNTMLQATASAGFMGGSRGGYSFYDHLSFPPKHHSQVRQTYIIFVSNSQQI